ncbi:putative protein transport protein [Botrytis fragariae]|uniref:Yos1-like protein n=1 Tax=Botrytis fragariae TaxID=1964551 RepID=A0A8H6EJB1_9HELO|nr:putative protein transport protein [Botrytis fragariae]KAF5874304.1 putative protein transport protein [Botrytis fragariae]
MFFIFGNLIYIIVLLTNAVAILSEDRFLARIGWSNSVAEPAFGGNSADTSIKSKLVNLMTSVRTLMRSMFNLSSPLNPVIVTLRICGFREGQSVPGFGGGACRGKGRKRAGSCAKIPLIGINSVIIIYELALG